ncbi:hypothetical protein BX600DRAFT_474869 [Xylariales sp. PMI_506]|nr:hypothetical protein BX600DRAFT_474869 [Xylariales sp. PMI_506]
MTLASEVPFRSSSSSSEYERHRDFLSAIAGIVFLGTPHRGSGITLFANIKINIGRQFFGVQSNDEIIHILKPDSYTLDDLQRQFSNLCSDDRTSGLELVCYYEMKEMPKIRKLVVTKDSATLDNAASRGIEANHIDMHNFFEGDGDQRDPKYDQFRTDLSLILEKSETVLTKRFDQWVYGSATPDAQRESMIRRLDPSREAQQTALSRKLDTHRSAPYTCRWIDELPEFSEWVTGEQKQTALWISGPAGSGKSVLAAYIVQSLRRNVALSSSSGDHKSDAVEIYDYSTPCSCNYSGPKTPVLYFFCGIERKSETTEKMLATLVHQMILSQPENLELFRIAKRFHEELVLGKALLKDYVVCLCNMADLLGRTYIVIDNLEDIAAPQEFLETLSEITSSPNIRLLISSQHTMAVSHGLNDHFSVAQPSIQITKYSVEDITKFIEARSAVLFQNRPVLRTEEGLIMDKLHSKAKGMFQWVNSALEHLKYVKDPKDVELQLEEIHEDLVEIYDKIFERLALGRTDDEIKRIQVSLKFIAASATPMTPADIKTAWLMNELRVKAKHKHQTNLRGIFDKEICELRTSTAESEVLDYLGSIVDICSDGTLQFKHPSIQKALMRTDSAGMNPGSERFKFTIQEANRTASELCMACCRSTLSTHMNAFADWRPPLVQYAWNYWAFHLKSSQYGFMTVNDAAHMRHMIEANPSLKSAWNDQHDLEMEFNKMFETITKDTLVYLEALIDFISRPLMAVPGRFSDREYVLSLQRAQESLGPPSMDLCAFHKSLVSSLSSQLQIAQRQIREAVDKPDKQSSITVAQSRAADKAGKAKSKLLGQPSTVQKLHLDDYLESNPGIPRLAGSPKLLLDITRNLRVVAMRFAVDPIYSALLATAGGSTFSPLHPIAYVAQLFEDGGTYPYWDTHPPARDLMEAFICPQKDPEYASAKFVLHCFEWRDPRLSEEVTSPTKTVGFYARTARVTVDIRPGAAHMSLTRVSTENFEQVKRLHQVKVEQFHMAHAVYSLFDTRQHWEMHDPEKQGFWNKLVTNPLSNLHMKHSLLAHEHPGGAVMLHDPARVINTFAPTEIQESPTKALWRSIPGILRVIFVRYFLMILEIFGRVARQTVASHFAKIEVAIAELRQVTAFLWRIYDPGELPKLQLWYLIPAMIIFWMRCAYFPSWGAYVWYHSWSEFPHAYKHPAAYLDLQHDSTFYAFLGYCANIMRYFFFALVGNMAIVMTMTPDGMKTQLGHAASVYSIFHCFCTIDRSFFAIAASIATLVASARVMFMQDGSGGQVFRFSLYFWFMVFVQILLSSLQAGTIEAGGGWIMVIGNAVLQGVVVYVCIYYGRGITEFLFGLTKPARIVAFWMFKRLLGASIMAAQLGVIALVLFMAWKAFSSMHTFIWDPYEIEDQLKDLMKISYQVRKTLNVRDEQQLHRIGWYPLGIKEAKNGQLLEQEATKLYGPPRANIPLKPAIEEMQVALAENVGGAAVEVTEYFKGAKWASDRQQLGDFVDEMVLESGNQVHKALDGIGGTVKKVVGGLSAQIPSTLGDRAADTKLVIRDAVIGNLKEE